MTAWSGVIQRYRRLLPVTDRTPAITLHEGNTPLLPASRLGQQLGLDLWLKFEGMNPTGSFKDRGMTLAMAKAVEEGAKAVICASTGNTSASAAAYAARAGLPCYVVIPEGAVAMGKLAQALMYGAKTIQIEGNFDDGLRLVRRLTEEHPEVALVNSVNPYRIEGQKTAAFEVVDALSAYPDFLAIPVGNAGNITAYWKGFTEYAALGVGVVENGSYGGSGALLPRMLGFQASGAAPLVAGGEVADPHTVGTAIKIGRPATREGAIRAARESGGAFWSITDEEMLDAFRRLAATEGVFAEPASCASVAGLVKLVEAGYFSEGADRGGGGVAGGRIDGAPAPFAPHRVFRGAGGRPRVVAVLTGHGLKDPDTAIRVSAEPVRVPAEYGRLEGLVLGRSPWSK